MGFTTNKGNRFSLGGEGGGDFSFKAPEDFNISCFGGTCGDCENSLTTLTCDIQEIPGMRKNNFTLLNLSWKPIIRALMDYLDVQDFSRLFLLNREFSKLRFDTYIMRTFAKKLIYTVNNQNRRYTKLVIENSPYNDTFKSEILKLMEISKNRVKNPYGVHEFKEWTITQQGGNGWQIQNGFCQKFRKSCFVTSYAICSMEIRKTFEEIFNKDELQGILDGRYILACGGFMGQNGFGGEGSLSITVYSKDDQKIFTRTKSKNQPRMEYDKLSMVYRFDDSKELPHRFVFEVRGKDTCFWAGHYGARFSGLFIRILPREDELFNLIEK